MRRGVPGGSKIVEEVTTYRHGQEIGMARTKGMRKGALL
jgi:hypothetical protein